jgi:hypothetical protein
MNRQTFLVLGVVTAIAFVGAVASLTERYAGDPAGGSEALLFPDLEAKVNDVAAIAVVHGEGTITLERGEQGWVVAEKSTYPARDKVVRETIIGLAGLRLKEAKTRRADRLKRLWLRDVEVEGSKSKMVRLIDGAGDALAEVIVGKTRSDLAGLVRQGVYVRRPGETQAWLARGRLVVSDDAKDWTQREILDIASTRVGRVSNRDADGVALTVSRVAPADAKFKIEGPAPEAKLKESAQSTADSMASALSGLELVDVKPQSEIDFAGAVGAEVKTFDGLVVHLDMVADDGRTWARVRAEAEADSVSEEAAAINARVGKWAYLLPAHKANALKTRAADLVEAKNPHKP